MRYHHAFILCRERTWKRTKPALRGSMVVECGRRVTFSAFRLVWNGPTSKKAPVSVSPRHPISKVPWRKKRACRTERTREERSENEEEASVSGNLPDTKANAKMARILRKIVNLWAVKDEKGRGNQRWIRVMWRLVRTQTKLAVLKR